MSIHPDDLRLQFDNGIEVGKEQERDRIIKLLEEASDCKCSPEYSIDYDNYCYCDALALIKGENK